MRAIARERPRSKQRVAVVAERAQPWNAISCSAFDTGYLIWIVLSLQPHTIADSHAFRNFFIALSYVLLHSRSMVQTHNPPAMTT